MSGLDFGWDTD